LPDKLEKPEFLGTVSKKTLGTPPHTFDFHVEKHKLENGKSYNYYVFHISHFSIVIPKINSKYVLIKQYRPSWRKSSIEFPAGVSDSYEEDPEFTGKRELQEETGYLAGKMGFIGKFRHTSRSTQYCFSYLAEDLVLKEQKLDESEFIEDILYLTAEEIEELIDKEEICDISHIATWYRYKKKYLS